MKTVLVPSLSSTDKETPACPVFGLCGGCAYQDIPYHEELRRKEAQLQQTLARQIVLDPGVFEPIVPSPVFYHYRNRLDLTFRRRGKEIVLGFQEEGSHRVIAVESCAIARQEISEFLPELKHVAGERLPPAYKNANLVVRTGHDGRVIWGGIGKGSLKRDEKEYLWTDINGKRIFYSLDTFFQANLEILPSVMEQVIRLVRPDAATRFLDLYAGVGLFGLGLADQVQQVVMMEESSPSVRLMAYNVAFNTIRNAVVVEGRVEEKLPEELALETTSRYVAMVDPPRKGLSDSAKRTLTAAKKIESLLYLSCHPGSLAVDLAAFAAAGWSIRKIIPFDFFPRTVHLETLVLLTP